MTSAIQGPIQIRRRAAGQATGAPTSLKSGELAINFSDNWLYVGVGDNGSGGATSIVRIAGFQKFMELLGDQTIEGVKTFSSSPKVPAPTSANDAATRGYVDSAMASAGVGDMLKSSYDTDNDGIVDRAELADAVAWLNVTGKPTEFPPADHDASKVTTGVFDIARIPVLPSTVQIASSGGIANLTGPQQAEIGDGSVVTTTDGRRWVYTGSGSKTVEASYITLADITPEWTVIANKPSTLSGYGITDAQTLDATLTALAGLSTAANKLIYATGADAFATYDFHSFGRQFVALADAAAGRTLLALGSLATQAANNVAITGGSLSNVTISDASWDGGTF